MSYYHPDDHEHEIAFAAPGSALRAAGRRNPRNLDYQCGTYVPSPAHDDEHYGSIEGEDAEAWEMLA